MNDSMYIWHNGELCKREDANIPILTHTLHYGFGFFEGIKSYQLDNNNSAIFRLEDHINRLLNSAKIANLHIEADLKTLSIACIELLKANALRSAYIRPILYIAGEGLTLEYFNNPAQISIAAWQWDFYLGNNAKNNGVNTIISSYCRHHPNATYMNTKMIGAYAVNVMAKMSALNTGAQEAILLDADGYIAEGTGENIFVVSDGKLYTPPRLSIFPGITRHTIINLAKDMNLKVIERRFGRDFLYLSEEAFFTGTAVEVIPIITVDNIRIGDGKVGSITKQLQDKYFECVYGKNQKYKNWLSNYSIAN